MAKKLAGLGRGLSEILGEVEEAYENGLSDNSGLVVEIDIDRVRPNPLQPRKNFDLATLRELADSIAEHGLLQPILVYEGSGDSEEYFLIAGERRLRASRLAGKDSIRAIVVDIDEGKLRELALIENIQREDLNPIDLAHSYKELIDDCGITHEEVARRLSKSRAQISNTLRLLELDESVQGLIFESKITQGHAKVLVTLPKESQVMVANSIIGQRLSVHDTEKIVRGMKGDAGDQNTKSVNNSNTTDAKKNATDGHGGDKLKKSLSDNAIELLQAVCRELVSNKIKANLSENKIILEFNNDLEVKKFSKILLG